MLNRSHILIFLCIDILNHHLFCDMRCFVRLICHMHAFSYYGDLVCQWIMKFRMGGTAWLCQMMRRIPSLTHGLTSSKRLHSGTPSTNQGGGSIIWIVCMFQCWWQLWPVWCWTGDLHKGRARGRMEASPGGGGGDGHMDTREWVAGEISHYVTNGFHIKT